MIANQQELYQLDKHEEKKPDAQALEKAGYITQEQLKAYNKAIENGQTSPQ